MVTKPQSLSLNLSIARRMFKKLCLAFLCFFSISGHAVEKDSCPLLSDIHRVEFVDTAYYVSGLQFPLNKNRYIVQIARALYTPDGHKWSIWTEPYSSQDDETAKQEIKKLLPTLKGPVPLPNEHYWGNEQCWYQLGNGLYVVARFWW